MDTVNSYSGTRLRAAVWLMLVSLTVMMAAIVVLYFAPLVVAPLFAASLYAGLWTYERRFGVTSTVTRVMTVFYVVVALALYLGDDLSWTAWFSPTVFLTLAALIFALLLAGRPFTAAYASDTGFLPLHRTTSALWGGLHLVAGVAALTLIPDPAFLYVPLGLMVVGVIATLWLHFVSMGPASGRRSRFEIEGYSFREALSPEDREAFHRVIAEAYRADVQAALGLRRRIDAAAIIRVHRVINGKWEAEFLPFLAFAGDRPVAGICIFFDHRRHGLPIEGEAQLDLTTWRRRGPVAEVGRFGVLRSHRISPFLLQGLFKCVVEAAAERRVHFVFNNAFEFQAAMYGKLGFDALSDKPYLSKAEYSTGYGLKALPMMMDLAGMVRTGGHSGLADDMRDLLAPYVMERFFKQLVVRDLASRLLHPQREPQEIGHAKT